MVKSILFIGSILIAGNLFSQTLEFAEPEKLTVNTNAEESMPILSSDGTMLFFTRSIYEENRGGKFAGSDIWVSQKNGSGWSKPSNTGFPWNDKSNDVVIGIDNQGKTVFLMKTVGGKKTKGIYFSRKVDKSWTEPELILLEGISHSTFLGFYMAPSADVLLISMKGEDSRGEEDLYISLKDKTGKWSLPKNLGPTINTSGFEISPFLTEDKNRLYFASTGHGGYGDADIFYSDRLYESWETWSVPRNLGSMVNSPSFEAYFSIYKDTVSYYAKLSGGNFTDIFESKCQKVNFSLASDQKYLEKKEITDILGERVLPKISFERDQVELSQAQRELLYYIVNKLQAFPDVKIQLVTVETDNSRITDSQLIGIYDFLISAGFEISKIFISDQKVNPKPESRSIVELRLFR